MTTAPAESARMRWRAEQHHQRHGDHNAGRATRPAVDHSSSDQLHVVYIAGAGRSGSTLLGDLLGAAPGLTHAGELRYVWQRGFLENRLCACADSFQDCAFWAGVREGMVGGGDHVEPDEVAATLRAATRVRNLRNRSSAREPETLEAIYALYRSVATESDAHIIIDSSKLPPYARLLDNDPRFRVSIVHLVRDPRGVVSSWARVKAAPDKASGQMQRMSAVKASLLWSLWNLLTLRWWANSNAYVLVRYEDFVAQPATTVSNLMSSLGLGHVEFTVSDDGVAELGANFGVAGNPDRFSTSRRRLRLDERWKEDLSTWNQRLTTTIAAPLLKRFRYPLRAR